MSTQIKPRSAGGGAASARAATKDTSRGAATRTRLTLYTAKHPGRCPNCGGTALSRKGSRKKKFEIDWGSSLFQGTTWGTTDLVGAVCRTLSSLVALMRAVGVRRGFARPGAKAVFHHYLV